MILVRRLPIILPLLFGLAVLLTRPPMPVPDDTTLDPAEKERIIKKVFDDIVKTVEPPAPNPPRLEIADINDWAQCQPDAGLIQLDESVYDICRTFGEDSLSALAAILGHELGHFYLHRKQHSACQRRARMGNISNIIRQPKPNEELEAEADYFGGLYSYLAGYNTLEVTPEVMRKLYKVSVLSDVLIGYLPKDERKSVALRIQDSLRGFLPLFDAGLYLSLARQYPESNLCYDYIVKTFPGREIFNNSGVACALHALQLMGADDAKYVYPLELDDDTRLVGVNIKEGIMTRLRRVTDPKDKALVNMLLGKAEASFKKAVAKDENYGSAVINLATVYLLKSDYSDAMKFARQAMKVDTTLKMRALALMMSGIAQEMNGNHDDAKSTMREAEESARQTGAKSIVQANIAVLEKKNFYVPSGPDRGGKEAILGIEPNDTSILWNPTFKYSVGGNHGMKLIYKGFSIDAYDVYRVEKKGSWAQFISTRDSYRKKTENGIAVGDPADSVKARYGESPRVVHARQGSYYIYDYSKIIFLIDGNGKVRRWIIYSVG